MTAAGRVSAPPVVLLSNRRARAAREAMAQVPTPSVDRPRLVVTAAARVIDWVRWSDSCDDVLQTLRLNEDALLEMREGSRRWTAPWRPALGDAPVLVLPADLAAPEELGEVPWSSVLLDLEDDLENAHALVRALSSATLVSLATDASSAAYLSGISTGRTRDLEQELLSPTPSEAEVVVVPWESDERDLLTELAHAPAGLIDDLLTLGLSSSYALYEGLDTIPADQRGDWWDEVVERIQFGAELGTYGPLCDRLEAGFRVLVLTREPDTAVDVAMVLGDMGVKALRAMSDGSWVLDGDHLPPTQRVLAYVVVDGAQPDVHPPVDLVVHLDLPHTFRSGAARLRLAAQFGGETPHVAAARPSEEAGFVRLLKI